MPLVLIVSRYFPPLGPAGASIRLIKFIKFAEKCNWFFIVFTQDPNFTVIPEINQSEFLLNEISESVEIERIPDPFTKKYPLIKKIFGQSSIPWGINVFLATRSIIKDRQINLIFVNTPPFTNAAIGAVLSKITKIPMVLDMKDDWVGSKDFWQKNIFRRKLEALSERLIVNSSRSVTVVTPSSYQLSIERYPVKEKDFYLISNGIDLGEYKKLENRTREAIGSRFTILTAASGYRPGYRDLTPFIDAFSLFISQNPEARDNLEMLFVGDTLHASYVKQLNLLDIKQTHIKPLGRSEFVEQLWQADLFFLVQPKENFTAISGTLYEYWATGKAPTLLISEVGASSRLVTENGFGAHFSFEETEAAARYLQIVYHSFIKGQPVWIDRNGIERFDRRIQTEKMLLIWENAMDSKEKKYNE